MAYLRDDGTGRLIEYKELITSLTSQFVNGESVVKRDFLVAWDERWIFARRILGYHYLSPVLAVNPPASFIRRVIPHYFTPLGVDDYTNPQEQFKLMYATTMESMDPVRPIEWDDLNSEGVNQFAKMSFTYRYPTYAIYQDQEIYDQLALNPDVVYGQRISDVARKSTDVFYSTVLDVAAKQEIDTAYYELKPCRILRYISKTLQPTAQHLIVPQGRMSFVDGSERTVQPPTGPALTIKGTPATNITVKLIGKTELVYTWHSVPTSDITGASQVKKIQRYIGSVNKYPFDGYPSQTLLFTAINSRPFRQIGGHYTTDIELRMSYFEVLELYNAPVPPNPAGQYIPYVNDDKAIGHNYFLRFSPHSLFNGTATPATIAEWLDLGYRYDLITHDGLKTGRRLYEPKDFYELFQPAAPA